MSDDFKQLVDGIRSYPIEFDELLVKEYNLLKKENDRLQQEVQTLKSRMQAQNNMNDEHVNQLIQRFI
jgi:cell division septum initiation protein DivIVA